MAYHVPVMMCESIEGLDIKANGIYVDLTFGGGGHAKAILDVLEEGQLIAFDQDSDTLSYKEELQDQFGCRFKFVQSNFRYFTQHLKLMGITKVDGILMDLGISSHQIDDPKRGFSIRYDGDLDMRMNQDSEKKAIKVINEYGEEQLKKMFYEYGEIRNASALTREIMMTRAMNTIKTTHQLKNLAKRFAPKAKVNQYLAKVFQAIRIEVNNELASLAIALESCVDIMNTRGRLVIISYHSLEDKLVKNFIRNGKPYGDVDKDFYGHVLRAFDPINRKPIIATAQEIETNSRARSAKLRIAEKRDY